MKSAKANRDEVRENSFTVLATKAEKDAYTREGLKLGLSRSAWIRMVLNEAISKR